VLVPLLADASVVIRSKACEALGIAHATTAGDALANLLDDASVRVRLAASLALFDVKDARGVPALHELADDPQTSHLMIPHHELGMMLGRQRDFAAARKELEQVATLAPTYVDGLVELAGVDAELGDLAAARSRVAQALALEPKHRNGLALAAKLH
jgi:Flp pilus assembly protein TadD